MQLPRLASCRSCSQGRVTKRITGAPRIKTLVITFQIIKKSKKSRARLGILRTAHGEIETPAFVPVATRAVVKTLTSREALASNAQLLIANTFHLHLRPGERTVARAGGLHKFMQWPRPLMTDSGGFQVFSLGFGQDFGTGKILKAKSTKEIKRGAQPQKLRITDAGVEFRSPIDGTKIFIGPRESIRIQERLGADIIFAFDECTSPIADRTYTERSLERSHLWAGLCLKYRNKKSNQALYGIVQGGKFEDLRRASARFIGALPFEGIGIGGEFGDDKRAMARMVGWVVDELPEEKPRHLLGIGYPEDILPIIEVGADTFDCIVPTHYARRGFAYTSTGKLDIRKKALLKDQKPLDKKCVCEVCKTYSRSYITHLWRAGEMTAMSLLSMHNLFYFNGLVAEYRRLIAAGRI